MIINSHNEWDPLHSMVVGTAKYANRPEETHYRLTGPYSEDITSVADADLNNFVKVLESEGVTVTRPVENDFVKSKGVYNYCPRDRLLVVGNTVVDCNMQYECRLQESKYLPNVIWHAKEVKVVPREKNIYFDAANVCRVNDTLLYLVSPSGTDEGAEWLQDAFPHLTIEKTTAYAGIHIDNTFIPVREGLVVVNKDRVSKETLPKVFKDWEIIWLGKEHLAPRSQQNAEWAMASDYIQFNFIMINPELAVIDQTPHLRYELSQRGVDSIVVPLTYSRELGGGHHCTTLDLHRE